MIIGSGMLANAFMVNYSTRKDVCVYASGVSNSSCIDGEQFNRERLCVLNAIKNNINAEVFLYF
jgi:UDP-2-acetamido-2,6-beta-L-arabino-hexul-4-ose reductase